MKLRCWKTYRFSSHFLKDFLTLDEGGWNLGQLLTLDRVEKTSQIIGQKGQKDRFHLGFHLGFHLKVLLNVLSCFTQHFPASINNFFPETINFPNSTSLTMNYFIALMNFNLVIVRNFFMYLSKCIIKT